MLYGDMSDYQADALETAVYPGNGSLAGLTYTTLALCGEAGELANNVKKMLRDEPTDVLRQKCREELGDVLWYVAACADELDIDLNELASSNIKKLRDRQATNTIHDKNRIKNQEENDE